MTPIKHTLKMVQQKIDMLKKDRQNDEFIPHLIELKEHLSQVADTEKNNIAYAWENGRYSKKFTDGYEYYNKLFSA